ncbi:MAG: type II secretion system F family protein [Terrimicrobiaceae bacterium]|nr:type II secretion system F family protein [Terrimicrobiaceae bacterium]
MRLSLQQKEQLFHELRELLRSGRSVHDALDILAGSRSTMLRTVVSAMRANSGDGTAEGYFAAVPQAFSDLDREVVRGGESAGRLDDAMGYLSAYYHSLDRTRRRAISHVLYPLFILHFGAVALAVPALVSGGIEAFLSQAAGFLAVFYILFALAWLVLRAAVGAARVNPAADQMLQSIPALGGTRIALVSSRFCMLMGILVKSSGGILSAMNRSATASGSALFQRGADEAVAAVKGGAALGSAVARTRAFPEAIDRAFQVGEASGRLDEEMERQATRFSEQFNSRLDFISKAVPRMIYVMIALVLAWKIVSFYLGYYQTLSSLVQ